MVQAAKKIAILHRYPQDQIKATNAAFPYIARAGVDVLTFKKFDRLNDKMKAIKSFFWIFYSAALVIDKKYDIIYCDDSFPFYTALVKMVSPRSKVIKRMGDFHLLYYTSGMLYRFLHFFEKIEWRMIDKIIAISDLMANKIHSEVDTRVSVALDPVDEKDFGRWNTAYYNRVMFHGLLTKNKNVDILLDAAYLMPDVMFWIVGDGPDKNRLEKIAPKNVIFKGWVKFDMMGYMINKCKVGVALRSNNPGNDYVVTSPFLQYSIMGKPCLVTRRKVFGDYKWQFSNVSELVEKIRMLLDRPEEGRKMREFVIKNHNAKKIGEEIWYQLLS